jgi:hypothetical protein
VRLLAAIGSMTVATMSIAACGSESSSSVSTSSDAAGDRSDGHGDETPGTEPDSSVEDTGFEPPDAADERPPSVRRPFLIGSSLRTARSEARSDWTATRVDLGPVVGLSAETSRELAKVWLTDALEEHASIAAFARFTMLLLSVGAPPDLVLDAQRASIDEVAHARDCFALARRYGATPAGPSTLDVHDAMGSTSLAELAALTTEEGCIGETLGAALAAAQLELVVDPEVRRVLERIVRDEARHAELAWRFVAWAVGEERRGSPTAIGVTAAVVSAAARAIRATHSMTIRPDPSNVAEWHTHGRVTCAEARDASERAIREIVAPCLERLVAGGALSVCVPQRQELVMA